MAVRKIINNSGTQYTPVVMDKIVLDTVPTVGSFNSVTSDAVARAITEAGNVPAPEASDAGKVLGVLNSSGDIGWVEDQSGTLTQVQSNWAESDNTQVSYIQNRPDLSVYAEASEVETALAAKQDVISDLATIRSGAAAGATAVQPASLATVATTGAYSDLSGKPDLSGFATTQAMNTALAGKQDTIEDLSSIRTGAGLGATAVQPSSLATVATTGDYDDLTNKPTIPAAQVQADWNESDTSSKAFILNKPVIPAGVIVDQTYDASSANAQSGTAVASAISTKQDIISDLAAIRSGAADGATAVQPGNLATVATTGAYSDLSGTPTIPVVDQSYSSSSVNAQSGVAVAGAIANKQDTIADLATIRSNALLGSTAVQPGDLATVATTGAYSDLSGTPTIPSGDELVPSASSIDAGKVLTVDNNGDPSWVTPSAGTVYTAGNGVDITNNVISADVDGSTIGIDSSTKKIKLLSTIPTVDQTYSASSANAQSGVAVASAISTKQDTIADLATIRSGAALGASAVQPSSLATVATSGSYNDLSDKPSIPAAQVNSDWNSSSGVTQILNKPTLATVATTGDYNDLSNKPSIPAAVTVDQTYNASSTNAQSGTAVAEAVAAISVDEVPTVTSNDDGKVLKATYENGSGSYGWESEVKKPIVAGANITITNGTNDVTIAATDTTYTFSTGLTNNSGTVSVTNPVPAASSGDQDKVLGVTDSSGTLGWVAQTGGGGNEVPAVTSSDDGKVLKASYSGGTGSYDWASPPTEKTLAAGSNVNISASGSTVTISATDTTYTFSNGLTNTSGTVTVDNPVPAVTSNDGGKVLTAAYSGGVGSYSWVTPSGGGGSGDKFTYHAPAHSIIFWFFENPSFDPSQDTTLSNILYANWTQLSSESNIWQLSLNSGSWANEFYDYVNTRSLFPVAFDILSINFSGVTSLNYAFRYAPVRHIHEVLGAITGEASYAFSDTTKLRGHVNIPEIASYYTDRMFEESTLDSIHIGKLYYEYYPAIEGDPDLGEPGYNEYYTCSNCTNMFYNCVNLKFVDFGVAYLADCSSMFHNCINLQNAAFVNQCVFGSSTLSSMFQDCKSLIWCPDFYFAHQIDQTSMDQYESMGSADHMFDGCTSLLRMPGFSGTTSNCSNLSYMFNNCSSLVSIQWFNIADIGYSTYEDWDPDTGEPTWVTTYNVTNVQNMFNLCSNVIGGAANAYQQMSATWTSINNHSDTFSVGSDVGSPEASQIPTSWGGSQS